MQATIERAIANQGALGAYCNALMLSKALSGGITIAACVVIWVRTCRSVWVLQPATQPPTPSREQAHQTKGLVLVHA
jgi:hypothetical protein